MNINSDLGSWIHLATGAVHNARARRRSLLPSFHSSSSMFIARYSPSSKSLSRLLVWMCHRPQLGFSEDDPAPAVTWLHDLLSESKSLEMAKKSVLHPYTITTSSNMDYLPIVTHQSWALIKLIIGGIRVLERNGVEKVYIIGILLLGALAVDSVLISLLNWLWYLICLGLLAIPVDVALRWQTRGNTSLDSASEGLIRSLEGAANHQSARIEAGAGDPPDYSDGDEPSRTRVLARRGSSHRQ